MAKNIFLTLVIAVLLISACRPDEEAPSFENRILGNWLVVGENYDQSIVVWSIFYVGSVKLYPDKSFKLNLGDQADSPSIPSQGTWMLTNDDKSIVFYTAVNDFGTTYRDTTEFNISLAGNNRLILENDWVSIVHKKLNN